VVSLKVSDIDSKQMIIRVEQGKGGKDRNVMLSPSLLDLLRTWWRAARPRGWLFPGRDPAQPMTTRQLNRACHAAAQMAEIKKRVSLHTLRHSFATHLLEQNIDVRIIQVLLGHAKLDTTALYTRVATKTISEVMSPLEHIRVRERTRSAVLSVLGEIDIVLRGALLTSVVSRDVCFALSSRPKADIAGGPKRANSGLMHRSKKRRSGVVSRSKRL